MAATTEADQSAAVRYCTRCAGVLVQREAFGRVRPVCPVCGAIVFVDPKVACAALVERDGRVLLVRRRNEPGRGLWCLPCGFADADEPPEEAARREAHEETGLLVRIEALLGAYHYTDDPRGAGILLVYRASCSAGEPRAGDDADDAGFFAADALPPLSHHTHQRALAAWVQGATYHIHA
jgi:ADP-ribose pyrophosphatase YjhB (NUDIX family)